MQGGNEGNSGRYGEEESIREPDHMAPRKPTAVLAKDRGGRTESRGEAA